MHDYAACVRTRSVYSSTNAFWRESFDPATGQAPLANVTVVSITGGNRDMMVASDLVDVSAIVPATHSLTVFTTGMPYVWLSVEHEVQGQPWAPPRALSKPA